MELGFQAGNQTGEVADQELVQPHKVDFYVLPWDQGGPLRFCTFVRFRLGTRVGVAILRKRPILSEE